MDFTTDQSLALEEAYREYYEANGIPDSRGGVGLAASAGDSPAASGPDRLGSALGLSTTHISPRGNKATDKWAVEVSVGGTLLSVKGRKALGKAPGGGIRGEVSGFSRGSRRRLMRKIASIDRERQRDIPIFGTLTYPSVWPDDPSRWKRDLDTWGKRLMRRYPKAYVIWKLEPQQRGAPHFHLVIFGVPWMDKDWLSQSWYDVVASGDEKHLRAGTRIENIRSWRGVMSYASKYTAKVIDELPPGWESVGRMWGIIGRKNMPITIVRFAVTRQVAHHVRDFLWSVIGGPPPGWIQFDDDGLTAIVDWHRIIAELRRALALDEAAPVAA